MREQGEAGRRRRRETQPRRHLVRVKLSEEDLLRVRANAAASRLSVGALVAQRAVASLVPSAAAGAVMDAVTRRALAAELYALKRILRGSATNLNQLARAANATGQVPEEARWHARRISAVLPRLDALLATLGQVLGDAQGTSAG